MIITMMKKSSKDAPAFFMMTVHTMAAHVVHLIIAMVKSLMVYVVQLLTPSLRALQR